MIDETIREVKFFLNPSPAFSHPLISRVRKNENNKLEDCSSTAIEKKQNEKIKTKEATVEFLDPLRATSTSIGTTSVLQNGLDKSLDCSVRHKKNNEAKLELIDSGPLNNTLAEVSDKNVVDADPILLGFRPWKDLRQQILDNFSTEDGLTFESSFLHVPKSKHELESQLSEEPGKSTKFYDLSHEEYGNKISDLRRILLSLWEQERRLECLKLITESARLLSMVSVPNYYPMQFVFVTDLLDFFGELVYTRLYNRAQVERKNASLSALSSNFKIHEVLEQTRITAWNWFGRVNEIKEVVPRIYVEVAIFRIIVFMDQTAIEANIMRLCDLAKMVKHPLISSYIRCYICRISMRMIPANRSPHWKCLNDWMQTYAHQPTSLLWPALEYVIQCVSYNAVSYDDLFPLWEYCRLPEKRPVILVQMLNALPSYYIGLYSIEACRIVVGSEAVSGEELCALGRNLLRAEIEQEARKKILKAAWKCVMRVTSLKTFVMCCDVWIEFVVRYFSNSDVHVILDNLMDKIFSDKKYESHFDSLTSILTKVFSYTSDVSQLLQLDLVPKMINLFQDPISRRKISSTVLQFFREKHSIASLTEVTLAYQVMDICKFLDSTLDVVTFSEQFVSASKLIRAAFDCFDLCQNPQQALEFFVDCRGSFLNNDFIQEYIVLRFLSLALFVVRSVRFTTSRATFLKACLANLLITIPSLTNSVQQIQNSIQAAQIAITSLAFFHVDAFFDFVLEAFTHLESQHSSNFSRLSSYFLATLSNLLKQNESTSHSALTIFSRFMDIISGIHWIDNFRVEKARCLLQCLQFLFVQWMFNLNNESILETCQELCAGIMQHLDPLLVQKSNQSLAISIDFVEIIALYAPQSTNVLPENILCAAKEAYKRCKQIPTLSTRLKSLNCLRND